MNKLVSITTTWQIKYILIHKNVETDMGDVYTDEMKARDILDRLKGELLKGIYKFELHRYTTKEEIVS